MKKTYLLYDKTTLEIAVPDNWSILKPKDPPTIENTESAIKNALINPIGTKPLYEIAKQKDKSQFAVIVISDITRPVPNKEFLPIIIDVLKSAGFADEKIIILIATGMHRPSTEEERIELVGKEILGKYKIIDHRANDKAELVELPTPTRTGTKVSINKWYYNAGLRILTGFIEPHFMAGFSGGRKSICPGLVDLATLKKFHGAKFLSDPNTRTGNLDGNPCHQEALNIAQLVPPDFILNVTINAESKITGVFAGDLEQAHLVGVEFVREAMTVKVDEPFDVVFTSGGGYPLDTTFYQTTKGMGVAGEYLKSGGWVIVASGCRYGIGSDSYRNLMFKYKDYEKFLNDINSTDQVILDQWAFQMHCRVLEKTGYDKLIFITDGISEDELRKCHVTPAKGDNPKDKLNKLINKFSADKTKRIAVIPRGPYIIPTINTSKPI